MKAFAIWLAMTLIAFLGLSGGYHVALTVDPHKVLVVVDSSFAMRPDWHRVRGILNRIEDRRYAQFSLATEKGPVHGYRPRLDSSRLTPYAPRDFSRLPHALPEAANASEIILITNAPARQTDSFDGWTVIRP